MLLCCCLTLQVFFCLLVFEIRCQSNSLFLRNAEDVGPVLFYLFTLLVL